MDKALFYLFVLSLFLMGLVYYVGLTSDAPSVLNFIKGLIYAATGRDNTGKFSSYPVVAK